MYKIFTLICFLFIVLNTIAQSYFTEQLSTSHGASYLSKISASQNGGVYVAGAANMVQQVRPEAYVAALNSNGKLLWGKSFNMPDGSYINRVIESGNNGLWMLTSYGDIIKLNPDHSVQFIKKIKFQSYFLFTADMVQDAQGNFLIAGSFGGRATPDQNSACLLKTDSNLNIIWVKKLMDSATSSTIIKTFDGGYAISGRNYYTDNSEEKDGAFLIKTDVSGNIKWSTFVDTEDSDSDDAIDLKETTDSGFIVGGHSIRKFSKNGKLSWLKQLLVLGYDGPSTVAILDAGRITDTTLADKVTLVSTVNDYPMGLTYIFYTLIDNAGKFYKKKAFYVGTSNLHNACIDNKNNIWDGGNTSDQFVINKSAPNYQSCNTFNKALYYEIPNYVVKVPVLTPQTINASVVDQNDVPVDTGKTVVSVSCSAPSFATAENASAANKTVVVNIYPNPAKDILHIEGLNKSNDYKLIVINATGETVINTSFNAASSFNLNVKSLLPNVYYLRIISKNQTTTKKFIKQ